MDTIAKKRTRKKIDPSEDREKQITEILTAREQGATLRQAAESAGVHVATVCRWQQRDPSLREFLQEAEQFARILKYTSAPRRRPRVPWNKVCPKCSARVVVRTAHTLRFWRCRMRCGWASWRPRAPLDCSKCGGYLLWSHSRKSVACAACKRRFVLG